MAAGDIAIYSEAGFGEAISTTKAFITFDTTDREDSIYSMAVGRDRVTLSEAGHYLILYCIGIGPDVQASPTRANVQYNLTANGTGVSKFGRSDANWRNAQGCDEAYNAVATIYNVSANDDVGLSAARFDGAGTGGDTIRTSTAGSQFVIIKLDDNWDYLRIQLNSTKTASTSSWVDLAFDVVNEVDTGSWTHTAGDAEFTAETAGLKLLTFGIRGQNTETTTSRRCLGQVRVVKDDQGDSVFAPIVGTNVMGYSRSLSTVQRYKCPHLSKLIDCNAGDVLKLQYQHGNSVAGGTWTPDAQSGLTAVALPDYVEVCRVDADAEQDGDSDFDIDYGDTVEEDTDSFDHDAAATTDVEVKQSLEAIMFYYFRAVESGGARNTGRILHTQKPKKGGSALTYGWASRYNRGDVSNQGLNDQGGSGCAFLPSLVDTDILEVRHENLSTATDSSLKSPNNGASLEILSVGSMFPQFFAIDETVEVSEAAGRFMVAIERHINRCDTALGGATETDSAMGGAQISDEATGD